MKCAKCGKDIKKEIRETARHYKKKLGSKLCTMCYMEKYGVIA